MEVRHLILHKLERASFSFRLKGAVLFGSWARGEAQSKSDLDLLVVGGGLPPHRQRRSSQALELKRLFPGVPMDILLMSEEETHSNFRNHNPLFLDIAEDGIVLLDPDGRLEEAMLVTRQYVRERGIERINAGWRFPVAQGTPTFLSKVSNSDFARAMLIDGGRDHQIAGRLVEEAFFDKAVYHFQQAVEKSAKAVLIALGLFQRTHLVGATLRDVCGKSRVPVEWREPLLRIADCSEELEQDLSLSRYPGIVNDALWLPAEEYDAEDARAAEVKSEETLDIAGRFVKDWFSEGAREPGQSGV